MSLRLFSPSVEIKDNALVRKSGVFYRERIKISDIRRVVAITKDSVTHEETVVVFFDGTGARVFLSEFDKNSHVVIEELRKLFPKLASVSALASRKPFERAEEILWEMPE
jgi:hypothetical protein